MKQGDNVLISVIAALAIGSRVIGKNGKIPWDVPKDRRRFREITEGHTVIMGRKTWESLPEFVRPLPDRFNIVLSRNPDFEPEGATVAHSIKEAVDIAEQQESEEIFVIGGEGVYKTFLPHADKLYLTLIDVDVEGDTHFPKCDSDTYADVTSYETHPDEDPSFIFVTLERT